ncbi:MAG: lysine--tRNA ligase, partial [Chloroflexi bacterium]|nr:lysine--tRNA ligase [Chloroflexota bacterium]
NEGISFKHNPEYTLLESYQAYADYHDVMDMVEQMVSTVAQEVLGAATVQYGGHAISLSPPWRRVTLRDAIKEYGGIDFEDYPEGRALYDKMCALGIEVDRGDSRGRLTDKLLSHYVEPKLIQPTFLLEYPVEMSPLAKKKAEDPRYVERFEGFIGGMEVANAFSELNDPIDQRERFMEQERLRRELGDTEADRLDEDFLLAIEHGMPPTGGLGMGIDRLAMLFSGKDSIREVILFPQLRSKE